MISSVIFYIKTVEIPRDKVSIPAQIVGMQNKPLNSGKPTCAPVFKYKINEFLYQNQSVNFSPNFCNLQGTLEMDIYVLKKDKYKVYTPDESLKKTNSILSYIIFGAGFGILINSIYINRKRKKQ